MIEARSVGEVPGSIMRQKNSTLTTDIALLSLAAAKIALRCEQVHFVALLALFLSHEALMGRSHAMLLAQNFLSQAFPARNASHVMINWCRQDSLLRGCTR